MLHQHISICEMQSRYDVGCVLGCRYTKCWREAIELVFICVYAPLQSSLEQCSVICSRLSLEMVDVLILLAHVPRLIDMSYIRTADSSPSSPHPLLFPFIVSVNVGLTVRGLYIFSFHFIVQLTISLTNNLL